MISSRNFLFYFLLILLVNGIRLTDPTPRSKLGDNLPASPNSNDFVCRNTLANEPLVSIQPGNQLPVMIEFDSIIVPGDCFFYISYDGDASILDQSKIWFKIAEIAQCDQFANQLIQIEIPYYLKPSSHSILRFEQYTLEGYSESIKYYCQCVDVKILDSETFSLYEDVLPSPNFLIPGHLPLDDIEKNYRNPNSSDFFFTGPKIAEAVLKPLPDPNLEIIEFAVLTVGQIAGISVGCVSGIVFIIFIMLLLFKKFKPAWYQKITPFITKKRQINPIN
jgi:nitrate reductase NapE component